MSNPYYSYNTCNQRFFNCERSLEDPVCHMPEPEAPQEGDNELEGDE